MGINLVAVPFEAQSFSPHKIFGWTVKRWIIIWFKCFNNLNNESYDIVTCIHYHYLPKLTILITFLNSYYWTKPKLQDRNKTYDLKEHGTFLIPILN